MLIGFTPKTSKVIPRIFCRRFRHCAIVISNEKLEISNWVMYQFIRKNKIEKIYLSSRDLKILELHGWVFIKVKSYAIPNSSLLIANSWTCVNFAKRALGIKKSFIITPGQLYRHLKITGKQANNS